jgi:hypothetical protein
MQIIIYHDIESPLPMKFDPIYQSHLYGSPDQNESKLKK